MGENTTAEPKPTRVRSTSEAAHAGLDVMLSEAAAAGPPRFIAPRRGIQVSAGLAGHPGCVASHATRLASELRQVARRRSDLAPRARRPALHQPCLGR